MIVREQVFPSWLAAAPDSPVYPPIVLTFRTKSPQAESAESKPLLIPQVDDVSESTESNLEIDNDITVEPADRSPLKTEYLTLILSTLCEHEMILLMAAASLRLTGTVVKVKVEEKVQY